MTGDASWPREERKGWSIPCPEGETPCSWGIFQGRNYNVGIFRCPAEHPRWARPNDVVGWTSILFPRTPVRIEPQEGDGGIIDPGRALIIEAGAQYDRTCLDPLGDRSEWVSVSPDLLQALVPGYDPDDMGGRKLPHLFSMSAQDYALQRRVFRHALIALQPDELLIEEAICGVLGGLRREFDRARSSHQGGIVDRLQELLAVRYRESLGLNDLAGEIGVSVPHLCRVFRRDSGGTIHDYRERLRFAAALDAFERGCRDLTGLALDLGYSSHAHFTANFTRSIGQAPSRLRAAVRDGMLS